MATTWILRHDPTRVRNDRKLGYSTGTTFYTPAQAAGFCGFIGTDGASETQKVCPISNISAQKPTLIIDPVFVNYLNVAFLPTMNFYGGYVKTYDINGTDIATDNVTTADVPVIDQVVFLVDAGTFGATNSASAACTVGVSLGTFPGDTSLYYIACKYDDFTTPTNS
jgi:hypothetical protein